MGPYADLAALSADIRRRLERSAVDRARHEFADRIIEYAVSNASLELPDVLVEQEVEVMHDELRASLRRQGLDEAAFLKVTEKTEADLHAEFRPNAEKRVKTLLVLTAVAEAEGVTIPETDVDEEVARGASRYGGDAKFIRYLQSDRGRSFVRTTLRRSRVVEKLIDEWLADHPEHPPMPHAEGPAEPGILAAQAAAAAGAELEEATAPEGEAAGTTEAEGVQTTEVAGAETTEAEGDAVAATTDIPDAEEVAADAPR